MAVLMLGATLLANAQSGTNSPYSQYGLGVLSDQTSGFNRGMNGVGLYGEKRGCSGGCADVRFDPH